MKIDASEGRELESPPPSSFSLRYLLHLVGKLFRALPSLSKLVIQFNMSDITSELKKPVATFAVKSGLAQMLKGGVIMGASYMLATMPLCYLRVPTTHIGISMRRRHEC